MDLNELRDDIHSSAVLKGFYDNEAFIELKLTKNEIKIYRHILFAQRIALIHSELSEALEADRKDKYPDKDLSLKLNKKDFIGFTWMSNFEEEIKNTVSDELSDIILRVFDLCGWLDIDIQTHIELKMKYNKQRGYKHGKNY